MTTALPYQGKLTVPVQWSRAIAKQTMQVGAFRISGTIGFHPWNDTAMLEWTLKPEEAQALMAALEAGNYNSVFTYTDNNKGDVLVRPLDQASITERRGTQWVKVTLNVEQV